MFASENIMTLFPREDAIPERFRFGEPLRQAAYLVNGAIRNWVGPFQDVESPVCVGTPAGVTRKRLGQVPSQAERESLEALEAAVRAYDNGRGYWPTLSVAERIRHMEQFASRMKEKREEVVKLILWEIGKTLPDAEKEFDRTVEYVQGTIDALKELDRMGSRFTVSEGIVAQIRRAPLGVVLCMGPYNYPLNETYTILIPALIMGNTVIFKPPKLGVLLHAPLLEALRDSFPPGVVNTVYGAGSVVVGPLMKSGKIDVLGFIGSSEVADLLKDQHPKPHRLRSILGLGAKNAAIILPDADLDLTVKECILGCFSYNGQRCTALKILFVHKKIAEEFLARFNRAVEQLVCGMPWEEKVQITPLPVPGKPAYLDGLVHDAVAGGAQVVNTGGAATRETFFSPTVLYPVTTAMRVHHEEQFGPVAPVAPFEDLRDPVDWIARSCYGQQVSLFGTDPDMLARLIDPLVNQVCRVNLNSQCQRGPDTFPFTGRKDSAEGTLSVSDALRVFSIRTLVAAKSTDLNKTILSAILHERKSNFLSTDFIL
jgi:glyceraldehyde-3-phosphate dehydrogenase (NADP+)